MAWNTLKNLFSKQQDDEEPTKGKLPLIIGVVGHYDIDFSDETVRQTLLEQVKQSLTYWRGQVGKDTPIWLMSNLAPGGSLLAAEAAMTMPEQDNVCVVATLPVAESKLAEIYAGATDAEREHLALALKRLDQYPRHKKIVLRNSFASDNTQSQHPASADDPAIGLLNANLFIARYCNVLLALWDGREAEREEQLTGELPAENYKAQPAHAIRFMLGEDVEDWITDLRSEPLAKINDFDGQEGGLLQHIPVSRTRASAAKRISCDYLLEEYQPSESQANSPKLNFKLFVHRRGMQEQLGVKGRSFLGDFLAREHEQLLSQLQSYNALPTKEFEGYALDGLNGNAEDCFNLADNRALQYQSKYRFRMVLFYVMAVGALVSFELFNQNNSQLTFLLSLLLFLGFAVAISMRLNSKKLKWSYQLSRGIAESFRLKGYLNVADIKPAPFPLVPRAFRLNFAIYNHAAMLAEHRWWTVEQPEHSHDENCSCKLQKSDEALDVLRHKWLQGQIKYLEDKLRPEWSLYTLEGRKRRVFYDRPVLMDDVLSSVSQFLFVGAVLIGLLLLSSPFVDLAVVFRIEEPKLLKFMLFIIPWLFVISGAIGLWREVSGYNSQSDGYTSLVGLYHRAKVMLTDLRKPSSKKMLSELAREAMIEHVHWSISERKNDVGLRAFMRKRFKWTNTFLARFKNTKDAERAGS